jgi:two-component system cell cycle response regulator
VSRVSDPIERRSEDRVALATVMLVEDSTATRRILRGVLEGASYRVTEAGDGAEALDLCRTDPPDLLLLDVDMPVMDGPEMISHLRADDSLAEIPVIMVSARTRAQDVADGLGRGALDYIRKPCAAIELRARVAAVLQRESQQRRLRELAEHANRLSLVDALTGAANRRRFDRRRDELLDTRPPGAPIGLVVLDIDHFKEVNDASGHLAGDAVLRILSRRLHSEIGSEDLLVRWGGEEFLVLAPDRDARATATLAARLHEVVGAAPVAIAGHGSLAVTASAGWACGVLGEIEDLILDADRALYQAKRAGRDRVVAAPLRPR